MVDRARLAAFLRTRREALQPEDVGLPRGRRRRTDGLRREEVAALCDMSADYYSRLEQPRGPRPSEHMLAAIARGLHLSLEERDHLFQLAGHATPRRIRRGDHISPGLMRILDRLEDTPAQVVNHLGETLKQTRMAVALLGDETAFEGRARSVYYRWFTDPASRLVYAENDRRAHSRLLVADLHGTYVREGRNSHAADLVSALQEASPEFAALWREHPVPGPYCAAKHFRHPQLGAMELHCQTLIDPDQPQRLLVFTAAPGTESHARLQLLSALGG
ncbi:helix-turn-helix transcriptional regulator [Streptomyces cylindrosporus]|uniref:Helix-turn-helix transcriptional regulator n=1 Tax=Streptomyces cylindrosporus TaxID=2927583 RepID=A0ABS9Y868_9ACTN|nr:helix-turn-helix transcriptional regulator [Streptomyces cylindrosporus]MCI3273409.1 helix-turn-helix transcriptional regulator [Streptomyces cylindrosporus]